MLGCIMVLDIGYYLIYFFLLSWVAFVMKCEPDYSLELFKKLLQTSIIMRTIIMLLTAD